MTAPRCDCCRQRAETRLLYVGLGGAMRRMCRVCAAVLWGGERA